MQQEKKELISSFMDGEAIDHDAIESVFHEKNLKACWHRYHIAREAMRGKLHSCCLTLDVSNNVAESIANKKLYETVTTEQPKINQISMPKLDNLFWIRLKDVAIKVSQVGLAACVTLGIITGVQYYQAKSSDADVPIFNTVPVGVTVSPVGGVQQNNDEQRNNRQLPDKQENDKIRLLIQDYELQKRLNTH